MKISQRNKVFILFGFIWVPSFIKSILDASIWPWDQSWYGETATRLSIFLKDGEFFNWLNLMMTSTPTKPPLMVWVAQFPALFGVLDLELSNIFLFFQLTLVLIVFQYSHNLLQVLGVQDKNIFLFGLIFSSSSLLIGLSTQFFVEIIQLLVIFYTIHIFWLVAKLRIIDCVTTFRIVIALDLVLLSILTTILFVTPFLSYSLFLSLRRRIAITFSAQSKSLFLLKNASQGFFALFLTALTVGWYSLNLQNVLGHLKISTDSKGPYANSDGFFRQFTLVVRNIGLDNLILAPLIILLFLILVLKVRTLRVRRVSLGERLIFIILLTCSIMLSLIFTILSGVTETRFLLPVVGLFVLLMVLAVDSINVRKLNLMVGIPSLILATYFQSTLLFPNTEISIINKSSWLHPIDRDSAQRDFYRDILQKVCIADGNGHSLMLGVDEADLNANNINFYNVELALRSKSEKYCNIFGINYFGRDLDLELKKIQNQQPQYFLTYSKADLELLEQKGGVGTSWVSKSLLESLTLANKLQPIRTYQGKLNFYEFKR